MTFRIVVFAIFNCRPRMLRLSALEFIQMRRDGIVPMSDKVSLFHWILL